MRASHHRSAERPCQRVFCKSWVVPGLLPTGTAENQTTGRGRSEPSEGQSRLTETTSTYDWEDSACDQGCYQKTPEKAPSKPSDAPGSPLADDALDKIEAMSRKAMALQCESAGGEGVTERADPWGADRLRVPVSRAGGGLSPVVGELGFGSPTIWQACHVGLGQGHFSLTHSGQALPAVSLAWPAEQSGTNECDRGRSSPHGPW